MDYNFGCTGFEIVFWRTKQIENRSFCSQTDHVPLGMQQIGVLKIIIGMKKYLLNERINIKKKYFPF